MNLKLYVDVTNRKLVKGLTTQPFQLPRLVVGDSIEITIQLLEPTGSISGAQYTVVSLEDVDFRVGIGRLGGNNQPFALQTNWVKDGANETATAKLSLATIEAQQFLGGSTENSAVFEVETKKDGDFDTVCQASVIIRDQLIGDAPTFPNISQGGFGGNAIGAPGESITLRSPDGTKGVVLWVDDSGLFHQDNITFP